LSGFGFSGVFRAGQPLPLISRSEDDYITRNTRQRLDGSGFQKIAAAACIRSSFQALSSLTRAVPECYDESVLESNDLGR
jgi:hypothetical protein